MKYNLSHNIPVITFLKHLFAGKGVSLKRLHLLTLYLLKLIIVIPVGWLQWIFYNRRINKTVINKPPVFILGHYRSGTTYLHKLMSVDPQFAFLKTYDIICPNSSLLLGDWFQKILQWLINLFRIKSSLYNNTIPNLDEPAEEERFLINKGSAFTDYWRFVFPACWNKSSRCTELLKDAAYYSKWKKAYLYILKLATFKNKEKQLVLKSPPNTERIQYLLKIFPDAKFIYILRNPYHVFYSTYNLWNKAIKKFCLQKISDKQIEEIVFDEYTRLLDEYEKQKQLIPRGNLIEVLYEDMESDALNVLHNIYAKLKLPGFKYAKQNFLQKIQQGKRYQKFEYNYSKEVFDKIEKRWNKYIKLWNKKSSEALIVEYELN